MQYERYTEPMKLLYDQVSQESYRRGRDLFEKGKVLELMVDDVADAICECPAFYKVSLIDPNGNAYVTVTSDAPVFGIWSPPKKNAPFVCIEPLYGRCDSWNYKGDWTKREWGNRLDVGEIFNGGYTIIL